MNKNSIKYKYSLVRWGLVTFVLMAIILVAQAKISYSAIEANMVMELNFNGFVNDVDLQNTILKSLMDRPTELLAGTRLSITHERIENDWRLISIASLDGPNCSIEYVGSGDCGELIVAHRENDAWLVGLSGTSDFSALIIQVPFLTDTAKRLLDPVSRENIKADTVDALEYKFPWHSGSWEYWNGFDHDNYEGSAIDIGVHGESADRRVLSSNDGAIFDVCKLDGADTVNVHVVHLDGTILSYYHLEKSSLGWGIDEGDLVLRGQYLGDLAQGSFDWDGCGQAKQGATSAHLHWVLPDDIAFTVDGWAIEYPDSTWEKDGQTRDPNQSPYYDTLPSTNYFLVHQIKSLWVPGYLDNWPYLFTASDNRITHLQVDDRYPLNFGSCRDVWLLPNEGTHLITFWYELRGDGWPTINIHAWNPLIDFTNPPSVCAIELTDPPIDDPAPTNDNFLLLSQTPLYNIVVSPGQVLGNTWRIRNTGGTTWSSGYQLVFVGGEQMSAPGAVSVPVTTPGQEVDISVNITSPSTEGDHIGYWRLRNSQGTYFGPSIWVSIEVQDGSPPPPSDNFSLTCSNCPATVEPGTTFRPTLTAIVGSGQLLESRGDMVRLKSGDLFGAWPHVAVVGVVNQEQSHDFTFYPDHPITAPTSEGTYQSTWQLWQNGQWAGPEYVIQFQVQAGGGTNHPPNSPTLTGPGDWALYYGNTGINLSAQHNGDPDGDAVTQYYFEIFDSAQNANSGWISSNSWSPQGLGFNGYQWRVKVRDSHGAESGWSPQVWHFNVINNEPEIYSFYSTSCWNEWGGPEKICFCASTNAGTLRVQVNDATDGSANGEWHILNELGVPEYQCNSTDNRPPNWDQLEGETGTHLVRLYARRDGGWGNAAVADITVNLPPDRRPHYPRNLLPLRDSFVNDLDVHFDWDDSLRTTSYHLEVSPVDDFSTLLVDQTLPFGTTEYDYTLGSPYETVYWRVTAVGPYGTNTANSFFHTDIVPPTTDLTPLPPVTIDTVFNVNWSSADDRSGVRWYHIQVKEGDRPTSQWEDWLVNTTKVSELFAGLPGHTYYFRIRAMDKIGNWEAWSGNEGDTFTLVDPSAAPPAAWWDESYAWKRNLVLLNNDTDTLPVHYPMHIHFDGTTTPTAAEIYDASLAANTADDIRVIYNDQTELNRFVQRFTSSQIDIWFPLQTALGGGASDSSSYQIYYGNSAAGIPPADVNSVFLPVADSNTMGLWHFQDGIGSIVADTSGRAHHGTFSNGSWGNGWSGWSGVFNGINSSVNAGNSPDFNSTAFTVEGWIYLNDVSTGNWPILVSKRHEGGPGGFDIRITADKNIFFVINDYMVSGDALQPNKWYHFAVVFNGVNRGTIFINGVISRDQSNLGSAGTNTDPLLIGYGTYVQNPVSFPGKIQHVRISNVARYDFPYARIDVEPSVVAGSIISPPETGTPDLAIVDMRTYPNPIGGVLVQVVVENQGTMNLRNGFYTDLYLDEIPVGPGDYTGSIRFWINDPIQAGSRITLTTVLDSDLDPGAVSPDNAEQVTEFGGVLYAQVDSTGVVNESDTQNNIFTSGTNFCVAATDQHESDDTWQDAGQLIFNSSQTHNFHRPGDEDWIAFNAEAGQTYFIKTLDLGLSADTYLYLYDVNGTTLLAENDDNNSSLASMIEWTAPASGQYFVRVKHWNPNVAGCDSNYTITIGDTPFENVYLPMIIRGES